MSEGISQMTYTPKGRTDEASFDYTDDPMALAMKFSAAQLREALADATEAPNGDAFGCLKFDYEEWVPAEALREALKRCGNDSLRPRSISDYF